MNLPLARTDVFPASSPLRDQRGRPLHDLRISVMDRCNFRCTYCMPASTYGDHYTFLSNQQRLSFDEIERLCRLAAPLGVSKLRLTGGEPLLRPRLSTLVARLRRLDGITDHVRFFDGWSGSFDVERQDATLDNYFAQLEAGFYAGLNEAPAQIYETIQEANGSVSQFRYDGVLMTLADAGNRAGDATIKQSVNFVASRRIKVS